MTNTKTQDVEATVEQILRLEDAGCEIVRCTVPDMEAAKAIGEIKKRIHIPLVADIHFDYRLAIAAMENGADKIRINLANEESFSYIGTYIGALIATETVAGSVKSTNADNGVTVKADGTMEVNSISIMKLTQNDDEFIVFDCGGADSVH